MLQSTLQFVCARGSGKEVTPQDDKAPPLPDTNAVDADAEVPWDDFGPEIPLHRPHFLSPWHFEFLKRHFANPLVRVWDPRWLHAYVHFPPPPGDPRLFRSAAEALAEVSVSAAPLLLYNSCTYVILAVVAGLCGLFASTTAYF